MATNFKKVTFNCEVNFPGNVLKSIETKLIIDFIKYLLYEKQQIPFSYDYLNSLNTFDPQKNQNFCVIKRQQHQQDEQQGVGYLSCKNGY